MAIDRQKAVQPEGPAGGKRNEEGHAHAAGDVCRCKETSLMKPRELLKLMFNDLAFWKKAKKG